MLCLYNILLLYSNWSFIHLLTGKKMDCRLLLVVSCVLFWTNNRQLATNNSEYTGIGRVAIISMHLHIKISVQLFSKYGMYE